jgi:hypothetical protein
MIQEMEARLNQMENLGFEEEPQDIKIAICTFAFDNSELIGLLKERGSTIKSE